MKKILFLAVAVLVLSSHDLFVKLDSYFLTENSDAELYLYNGTFDLSENIITRDRIQSPVILGPNIYHVPDTSDWYDKGEASYLKFKTGESGTYIAGISTRARPIDLSAKDFNAYLEHDGILDVLEDRKRKGIQNQAAKELYSKHVKAMFQVGDKKSNLLTRGLGYPIEFVALENPYTVNVNDEVEFLLLRNQAPLPNQLVYAGFRSPDDHAHGHSHDHGHDHSKEKQYRTNDQGIVKVKLNHEGFWYLRTIHMEERTDEYDYESNWATLSFQLK